MAERLQDKIRRRAAERDAEGEGANPSLEDIFNAARGTPLQKRKQGHERLIPPPRSGTPRTTSVRTALRKAAGSGTDGSMSPFDAMLGDFGGVLTEFRKAEGRDPTAADSGFWKAYLTILKSRLDAELVD